MKKIIIAILMTLALLLTLMPIMTFAAAPNYSSMKFTPKQPVDSSRFTWEEGMDGLYPEPGDVLTIDGIDYTYVEDTSTDEWFFGFRDNNKNEFWTWDIVYKKAGSKGDYLQSWQLKPGKYNAYFQIYEAEETDQNEYHYYGNEKYDFIHEVTIKENRVEYINYIPAKSYYTVAEINKYKKTVNGYIEYDIPSGKGDQLAIKYKGKAVKYIPMTKDEYGDYEFVVPEEAGIPQQRIYAGNESYLSYYTMSKGYVKPVIGGTDAGSNYQFETSLEYNGRWATATITVSTLTKAERKEWFGTLNKKIPTVKKPKFKAAKKSIKVSWTKATKKNLKKFDKVEIQVCKDKKFQRTNTKRVEVKKTKKTATVKKLKKGTYYVRVRNVKGSGVNKQVSKWSKVKKVKVKK